MTDRTYRRLFGLVFGAAVGLAFAVTSQAVNPLLLPGVTFHQPPLGLWGNLAGAALACGLIGVLVAWWDNTLTSILIAAVLTGLCVELVGAFYETYIPPAEVGPLLVTLLILWLPMTGLLGAVFFLLRWIINKQVEQRRDRTALWRRVVWPGLALIIAGGIGAIAIYPAEGQLRVREMDALIQAGLRAPDRAAFPAGLSAVAEPFRQHATPAYTLQWVRGDGLPPWRIGQPAGYQSWELSIVAARFVDGWILACLFLPRTTDIRCHSYERDPTVKRPPAP
jgi:hypothetical protein